MRSKNILVIGGTGFIGYHLIKFLIKKNYKVTSISTRRPRSIRYLKNVIYIQCDLNKLNKQFLNKRNFDYVVNLGGYVDHSNLYKTYKSHYKGVINLYNIFKNVKIKAFVQIGSSLEYGKVASPQKEYQKSNFKLKSIYAKSKLLATNFLLAKYKNNNFPVTVIRGYQVYGPRQDPNRLISNVIVNCLKNKSFPCSSGEQERDFLYIDDFISAINKVLLNRKSIGHIINIGYGKTQKVKKVILEIKNIINKGNPNFNKINLRKDESIILFPSIKKAKKVLNWKPKVKFIFGLKKTIQDYKKYI